MELLCFIMVSFFWYSIRAYGRCRLLACLVVLGVEYEWYGRFMACCTLSSSVLGVFVLMVNTAGA